MLSDANTEVATACECGVQNDSGFEHWNARAINEEAPHPIGQLKRVSIRFGEVSPCADAGLLRGLERRRSSAMPMLSMNTTKLMNPIVEIPAITDDAGHSAAPTSQ
jgi:hypothetical protein